MGRRPPSALRRPHQSRLEGEDDGLHPVAQPELGQQPAHVGLDGRLGDVEALGDLGVGEAVGDGEQDLALALGQAGQRRVLGRPDAAIRSAAGPAVADRSGSGVGVLLEQAPGDARRHDGVTAGHRADGGDELGRRHVLEQEPAGAGPQRAEGVLVEVERGEDEHPGAIAGLSR